MNRLVIFFRISCIAMLTLGLAVSACGKKPPPAAATPTADATMQSDTMAHQHGGDAPIASPAVLPAPPTGLIESKAVAYGSLDGASLTGYLAKPVNAAQASPGVLMFHEWWGLNDNIRRMADQLAAKGYVVLAMDMYDGHSAQTPDEAQKLMAAALSKMPALDRNIQAGYDYLSTAGGAGKIATLGWCFGGTMSFEASQVLSGKLAATVIYYGFVNDKPEALAKLKAPVLGLFGGKDGGIPVATVQAFEQGLEAGGAHPIIKIYPDAGHAFANPSGKNYRAEDADNAWKMTLDFLGENMQS